MHLVLDFAIRGTEWAELIHMGNCEGLKLGVGFCSFEKEAPTHIQREREREREIHQAFIIPSELHSQAFKPVFQWLDKFSHTLVFPRMSRGSLTLPVFLNLDKQMLRQSENMGAYCIARKMNANGL